MSPLHGDRRRAESFGAAAERYDRSRPSYPAELLDTIVDRPGLTVLDVGCGTGIASRQMAARGARVLGVEVDARMAEQARSQGTEVEVGRIEDWEPYDRSFDRVTAAQAWHWVDPVQGAVKAARVLRPGGRLCLFWNIGEPPEEVGAAFGEVYKRLAPGADGYSVILGYAVDEAYEDEQAGIRACADLGDPVVTRFPWSRTYTREEWLDQLPTHSDHAAMEPELLEQVLDEVGAVIDGFGGSFVMTYSTLLITADRR
ncbi:MAG TPA: class I SAM-dependent methyltransferase [Acidimicrobiales bacterium]|nr:class I SAM-dependent methyltransferase [Acidimicrobiales bacterium]